MQEVLLCSEPVASDKQAVWKFHKSLVNSGSLHNFLNNKISRPHFYRFLFLRSDMGPLVSWSCLVKSHESQLLGFKESCETHIGSLNLAIVEVFTMEIRKCYKCTKNLYN